MQLFEKWENAKQAYNRFYEEAKYISIEVSIFLKSFNDIDNSLTKAVLKMFDNVSDRFSILVKTAESVDDYPLVFRFENDSEKVWEFIVRDKPDENKTMRDFLDACERDSKTQLLEKQIERAKQCLLLVKQHRDNKRDCAVWIIDFLIVELLISGGFDD
ncbi:hypothetical protein [Helicobacter pylori]|uniref:hypothetical protein n=1 Tax=Helicobacter pylori TaxID=210 RepID=UPI000680B745|nr:hypothetical protein [Helicobacter pylori]KNE08767.1 hypothetical protein ACM27_08000 [Helicobacter pylori]OJZ96761.1 hypothetical protein AV923_0203590 [Helicobacter pylori]OJZ98378.1 hypothetical protein AV920_0203575 [Helicobacter pylori]